ncbi:aspartate racemase [Bacillus sp. JCM 19046]|uniref:Aspartate racemase n=1 Tax=Shouchella xiaoxiensis TaxID=766895 RepID=A0ABS2SW27_9BACI|nr:aspartate/glutamate racemase family protein [Shouchella xiaoxiensis]MBM7839736.1 aspartate racemase [Shouchella xiaoxiensis]GAF14749.1 aspartate racemase [Bacillus sp. JCM 19045]GAF16449.1 aspartate racemase [Bacillus sp. JCM 19046]
MKTIGLIGGLSWESSVSYYQYINEYVKKQFGGLHSAKCLLYSFDFQEIVNLQRAGNWTEATSKMVEAGQKLKAGGAELLVICTNTMHLMADDVEAETGLPVIHIVDALAESIKAQGMRTVGLLGTQFTMEKPFYRERMEKHGIELIVPEEADRKKVHDVIFNELCVGTTCPNSKQYYLSVVEQLADQGAEGVILGCTEIPLLINQSDSILPLFDSTKLHAESAVSIALEAR